MDVLSVSALTQAVKQRLESHFPLVHVQGEVSNFKSQASGHLYFTLKDAQAQISAVIFRGNAVSLSRLPKEGDQVIVKGEITVYAPRGSYQILIRELQFAGVGELLLKLHALKAKLEKEGLFETARKKKLPSFPKTIGVITSPTGAVIQDILNVLSARFGGFHLILNPVRVQGEGAAQEIAQAIEQFNRHNLADVLIVGRGGGSLEDLWPFNEEVVVRAIFHSTIPIISAVGHETDVTLSDYAADVRAPTPSAAAALATVEKAQQLEFLAQTHHRMSHLCRAFVRGRRSLFLTIIKHPYLRSTEAILGKYQQQLDDMSSELSDLLTQHVQLKKLQVVSVHKQLSALNPLSQVHSMREKLLYFHKGLQSIMHIVRRKKEKLAQLSAHLKAIDPRNLLSKGYCILFEEKNDSVILSSKQIEKDDAVRILFHDGRLVATVTEVNP